MVTNKAAVIVCCLLAFCSTFAAGTNINFKTCDEDKTVGKPISVDETPFSAEPCVFHMTVIWRSGSCESRQRLMKASVLSFV